MADQVSTASPVLPDPVTPLTQADLLAVFDRIFPPDYLAPMKAGVGDGYELLQAFAALGARVSLAVSRAAKQSYIGSATGGSFATVSLQLSRPTNTAGAVTVNVGTVLLCSGSGRMFVTQADVVFGRFDLGPLPVTAQAVEQSYEYNVAGPRIAADGTAIPGEVDTVLLLRETPAYGDPTIQVQQLADAAGGCPPALDQIGDDRGIPRRAGEGDLAYRARLKQLPDTVSPGAIRRAAARAFVTTGVTAQFVETWEIGRYFDANDSDASLVWDAPDDAAHPFENRWMDQATARGAFILLCSSIGCEDMPGIFFDDSAAVLGQLTSPDTLGPRAVPAWDLAPGQGPEATLAPAWDGPDSARDAVYAGLWDVIQAIKPAGVLADFELVGQ